MSVLKNMELCSRVGSEHAGLGLGDFLSRRFTYYPKEEWVELVGAGKVTVNGVIVGSDYELSKEDLVTFYLDDFKEPQVPDHYEPVFENDDFLLVGKAAGTPVSRTGRIIHNTLVNILRRQTSNPDIHLMHRLDRETSGLILCAKGKEICRLWQSRLAEIIRRKFYLAIVRGKFDERRLEIDVELGSSPDSAVHCQVVVVPAGKTSRSVIHPIATRKDVSLVLVEIMTGRRHQIRTHLAHVGYPVVGDKIYGNDGIYYLKRLTQELDENDYQILGAVNHTLHAWALDLALPGQGRQCFFSEIFSPDFNDYLKLFRGWQEKALFILSLIAPEINIDCQKYKLL
ncbi:MAG: RluA family pseudouridine synthase [Proteobacteria bacterium]|nr:RluA family pseudouridine synthase [Pseudomonadota bacterium]MBU1715367.1 RluA family pseudouridine synthase [Pseudomonadota bacterium]